MIRDRKLIEDELADLNLQKETLEARLACLPEDFDYPLCFELVSTGKIVKFEGLNTGEIVWSDEPTEIGKISWAWRNHTDASVWTQIAFNKARGLYDKQLVWCSDTEARGLPYLAFYDATKDRSFNIDGKRLGSEWGNFTPAYVDEQWVKIAYDKLED